MTYCSTLKNFQVENVLCLEAEKANERGGGDLSLYYEAREELARRGIEPDYVLRERKIRKPQ